MTEEEKEAIEILRFSPIFRGRKPENDCLEIVLNLIGKLQKELEEKIIRFFVCVLDEKGNRIVTHEDFFLTTDEMLRLGERI